MRAGMIVTLSALSGVLSVAMPSLARADGETVKLKVLANIPARCGIGQAPDATTASRDVNAAVSFEMPFKVDCNQPFIIRVASANGALRAAAEGDSFGFLTLKPYEVGLEVGLSGSPSLKQSCFSASLDRRSAGAAGEAMGVGCPFFGVSGRAGLSSDQAIAASDAALSFLKISWSAVGQSRRLLAGSYQDTLTIEVVPKS